MRHTVDLQAGPTARDGVGSTGGVGGITVGCLRREDVSGDVREGCVRLWVLLRGRMTMEKRRDRGSDRRIRLSRLTAGGVRKEEYEHSNCFLHTGADHWLAVLGQATLSCCVWQRPAQTIWRRRNAWRIIGVTEVWLHCAILVHWGLICRLQGDG